MRRVALLLVLVGCAQNDPYPDPGGPGDPGAPMCTADTDCSTGQVCARTGECLATSEVYTVHVTWTLLGQPASQTSCASSPDLAIYFNAPNNGYWGYAPVPCAEGKFTVDKLPTWFNEVQLGLDNSNDGTYGTIDQATGLVTIDLPY
jgi:hypothetical protein